MNHIKTFLLLGVALGLLGNSFAQSPRKSQFDEFEGDGYYWYKQDAEPVQPMPPKKPLSTQAAGASPAQGPKPLSTEWMRENMPKLLSTAVDDPTAENVSNYMYAQRVLLDKSQNFSEKVKEVVATDPFLDENNRVPIAQFAQASFMRGARAGQAEVLSYLGTRAGLWVFVDEPKKCSACNDYFNNIIVGTGGSKGVATEHGITHRRINVNTTAGKAAAKRLNLKVTPTTVLVIPPGGFFLVSQGLMAQDQLADRLLIAAKTSGILPKDLEEKVNPYSKGVLTTQEMAGIEPGGSPSDVMKTMRERIKGSDK